MTDVRQQTLSGRLSYRHLLVLLVGALILSLVPPFAAPAEAVATNASHPFSHPLWAPVRAASDIGCVRNNCDVKVGGGWHNYWAIDFYDPNHEIGDPVFAAGAGRFHIGGRVANNADAEGCLPAGSKGTPGNWVWIDHGGGIVSRYHHLHAINSTLSEGQLVTPTTQIGTRGHSGNVDGAVEHGENPCEVVYLHWEVRRNGVAGVRINPGSLSACVGRARQVWPRDLAPVGKTWSNWDQVDPHNTLTPASHHRCIPAIPKTAHRPGSTGLRMGDRRATISWPAPDGTSPAIGSVVVSLERYSPAVKQYLRPVFKLVSTRGAGSTTFTGLSNGFTYRAMVAYRNAAGYSAWGPSRRGIPAAPPDAPTKRDLTSSRYTVRYAWACSRCSNGTPVTGFIAAIRTYSGGKWGLWRTKRLGLEYGYRWVGLRRNTLHQVKVRATSRVGPSTWSYAYRIRTLR